MTHQTISKLKRALRYPSALLGIAAMLAVVGCEKPAPKEIKIGTINATTGMFASFGEGGLFGVQAAVDDINKQGGIKVGNERMLIKLIAVNSESDPNKTGALTEGLILQDGVKFIVAGDSPPPLHAGVSLASDRHKIPYVASVGPFEPWLGMKSASPTGWKYSWGVGGFSIDSPVKAGDPRADKAGYTVANTWTSMLKEFGPKTNKKMGIICSDEPDGRGWYTLFAPMLTKMGYEIVGLDRKVGLLPLETTDFTSVINEWKKANVEIVWGNLPAPFFGAFWKQAKGMGLKPKMVALGRAAMFYQDIMAWGGDLPYGISTEVWWDPNMEGLVGVGGTTGKDLAARWEKEKGRPAYPAISPGYACMQVLANAIERAGTLDADKVNEALATTNMSTMRHFVKFDENHLSHVPIAFAQWFKSDNPKLKWEMKITYSDHPFWKTNGTPMFPMPE